MVYNGQLLGISAIPVAGGDECREPEVADVEKVTGTHNLYFVFKSGKSGRIMLFDYWMSPKQLSYTL